TGSYVLVHEPSQTVMVGDDLDATYARLQEHVRADPTLDHAVAPSPSPSPSRRGAWLAGVGALALLPFLWLGVLHYTLGRLIDELRATPVSAPAEDVQALRAELEELRQVVSRVEDEVGRSRRAPAPGTPRPRPIPEQTRPGTVDEDAGAHDSGDESGEPDQP